MRRVIPRLLVACCTFALGLSAAALRHETRRPASRNPAATSLPRSQTCDPSLSLDASADPSAALDLPLIPYCELAVNPDCYNGKMVRVAGRMVWSKYGDFFRDTGCPTPSNGMFVVSSGQTRMEPTAMSVKEEDVHDRFMKECGPMCHDQFDVVAIGIFEEVNPTHQSKLEFGPHAFLFDMKSLESVSRVHER